MSHNGYIKISFVLLLASIIMLSCKKDTDLTSSLTNNGNGNTGTVVTANPDLVKDSALLIARDLYLWYDQIPASFNARSYADPSAIIKDIRPYSIQPGFNGPVDRWSFAMKKTEWDKLSAGMASVAGTANAAGDFGMSVFFRAEGDLRVRLVEPNSPAGQAGIKRGWRITQINGSSNMTTSNAAAIVDQVYYASNGSFNFTTPDGGSQSKQLNASHYTEKPVYLDTVYNYGANKIGYLVYNSFLGNITDVKSQFQQVFSRFAAQQVTDVVVDLRYNGGGYVSLAEQLANYLAPASANGGVMMSQVYNNLNTQNNSTSYFRKQGNINLPVVYFIVSKSSASASELLINTLRPYMDVRLVGPSATHGKPVGYFPVSAGDWYVFPVSFKTTNKDGEGNYYNGLTVNAQVADGLDKDWGDVNETSLATVIKNITTGSYARPGAMFQEQAAVSSANTALDEPFLKITIGTKN